MTVGIQLNKREKTVVSALAAGICLLALWHFAVAPFFSKRQQLRRAIAVRSQSLAEIRALQAEYEALRRQGTLFEKKFARREKTFTLFSFLDRLAGESGIKANITYMKPSSTDQPDSRYKLSLVEMKLQGVNLEQLSGYLYRIETSPNMVAVKRLSVTKTGKAAEMLSAVLQVETLEI
ncbi:MAG: type II secretion system protein GspM [Desulfobacterales bacterium]